MLQQLLTLNLFGFFLVFARIGTTFVLLPGFSAWLRVTVNVTVLPLCSLMPATSRLSAKVTS